MKKTLRAQGQIRQSQVVNTFGPGAMMDLPKHAVVVGGLDHWMDANREVFEERLIAKVEEFLGETGIRLFAPPVDVEDPPIKMVGIKVWLFPQWFIAQYEDQTKGSDGPRRRPLIHLSQLVDGRYWGPDKKKHPVVPVRFVQACLSGHLSDIEWRGFSHEYQGSCSRPLWLEEQGTSGDLADVYIHCECGKRQSMARATRLQDRPLGHCKGERPWLGPASREGCGELSRLLIRSASDAYFPQILSVISIPDRDAGLRKAVDEVWNDFLQHMESAEDVKKERRRQKVGAALADYPDDKAVFAEIERRKGKRSVLAKSIKQSEIEVLLKSADEIGEDVPSFDFYARSLRRDALSSPLKDLIERVVLVHRLREVSAQVGFTRFEPAVPDVDGELNLDVRRAALATELKWVPAVENRGEGVFIAFTKDSINAWKKRPEVVARGRQLMEGFDVWAKQRKGKFPFPGLPYYMLHSMSHLLITAVSLECGYSASSINERIYAGEGGYGILLYTGSPDAEGTLGGLVEVGRRIEQHLLNAIELGRLCSNDPVCSQHPPENKQEERFLHGAACHGCVLIAETSCERRNDFLDRALVVPTVDGLKAEYFSEEQR